MKKGFKSAVALAPLAVLASATVAHAATTDELDQRIKVLERQLEIQAEEAATKAKDATVPSAGEKGFALKKGDYELKIKALAQFDARFFLDGDNPQQRTPFPATGIGAGNGQTASYLKDSFQFRRIRPTFEGSLGKLVGFRLTPEFANSTGDGLAASIVDAYIDLKFDPAYTVRAGKVKGPIGLERLQSGASTAFIERGLPTELVPNRDLGVQLQGEVLDSRLNYVLGVYNGTADGRDIATSDDDNRKEIAGRLFTEPFKNEPGFFQGLGFGIAGSIGAKASTAANTTENVKPRIRSTGQNQVFQYETAVVAQGDHTRLSPQAYFYRNNLGLLAEYVESEQGLARGAIEQDLKNTAWQVVGTYVLTGEDASYRGVTKVKNPWVAGQPGWGALELALRYGSLEIDDAAFEGTAATRFADPRSSVKGIDSFGVGLNWYLNNNVKLVLDYNQSSFDGGAGATNATTTPILDRKDEKAVFTRLQLSF